MSSRGVQSGAVLKMTSSLRTLIFLRTSLLLRLFVIIQEFLHREVGEIII